MSGLASRPTAATSAAKIARSALSCAFVALGLSGCDDGDSPLSSGTELLVVTGYLFAGEPVGEVDVSVTVPLDSESEVAPAVNDARLVLTVNETSYELELALGDSGRYAYPAGDLTVMPGDALSLRVERGDMVVRAATVVPPAPVNLTVSAERLVVEPDTAFAGRVQEQIEAMTSLHPALAEPIRQSLVETLGDDTSVRVVAVENTIGLHVLRDFPYPCCTLVLAKGQPDASASTSTWNWPPASSAAPSAAVMRFGWWM